MKKGNLDLYHTVQFKRVYSSSFPDAFLKCGFALYVSKAPNKVCQIPHKSLNSIIDWYSRLINYDIKDEKMSTINIKNKYLGSSRTVEPHKNSLVIKHMTLNFC